MPRIFDNIALELLPALRETLEISQRSDFCVGYFNLRGWKAIDGLIEKWPGGEGQQCRLLVGMQRPVQEELRAVYSLLPQENEISQQAVIRLKRRLAEEFRAQLTFGAPNDEDEAGLRRLSAQLKSGKVVVKLFLRHTLHAKLYLCFRPDPNNPITGFVGSSNLTLSGLSYQGELNVDVLDQDATKKLSGWFEDRWKDRWCIDITKELIQVIDESWARPECPPPYHIYVKMAYHLAEEARAGLSEFTIPADMRGTLLEFQSAAVRIAARHLEKRGGVILGDVVGLGKTLMATALARVFQDPPRSLETLIICPKNLVGMWEDYAHRHRLIAEVVSITQAQNELPDLRRYRVVFSTKALSAIAAKPAGAAGPQPTSGAMVYVRTADGNDALAWVDEEGKTVTESQHEILRAAACEPATPALPRLANHHPLVQKAVAGIQTEHITTGGQLGKPTSARRRVYERLKDYAANVKDSLFDIKPLHLAIDEIYEAPLTEAARDLLNREMRSGINDEKLVALVLSLAEEDRLCVTKDDVEAREPKIICSLGIRKN